jgi:iron(III) transport system substrate-binding protein
MFERGIEAMRRFSLLWLAIFVLTGCFAAEEATAAEITVYSGRAKTLIEPLLEKFEAATGVKVKARYGDSAELAATILEEGVNSPADVFWAQDAGALGALAAEGKLAKLEPGLLDRVEGRFRSPEGLWVGTSGRARTVVYNTKRLNAEDLPASILEFTDAKWKGRLGWAPTNGSFQAFITAMRRQLGDEQTREWVRGILANEPRVYPKNSAIVAAVGAGEVDAGFVNHYYLFQFLRDQGEGFPARNFYQSKGDPGALVNVAGAAILKTSKRSEEAERFIGYLLSEEAQNYFARETYEYPLIEGVAIDPLLRPLSEIETPALDLSRLDDLAGTLELLQEAGALE